MKCKCSLDIPIKSDTDSGKHSDTLAHSIVIFYQKWLAKVSAFCVRFSRSKQYHFLRIVLSQFKLRLFTDFFALIVLSKGSSTFPDNIRPISF